MSAYCAPEVQTFWPLTTNSSPTISARVLQRRQIGARAGLGISLAPDFLGGENFRQEALLLFLAAPRDQRRPEHPEARTADEVRRLGAHHLVVDDRLLDRVHRLPAVFLGPCERDVTGLVQFALPRLRLREPGLVLAPLGGGLEAACGISSASKLRTFWRNASSSEVKLRSMCDSCGRDRLDVPRLRAQHSQNRGDPQNARREVDCGGKIAVDTVVDRA